MKKELEQVNASEIAFLFIRTNRIIRHIFSDIRDYYREQFHDFDDIFFVFANHKVYFVGCDDFYFFTSLEMRIENQLIRKRLNENVKIRNQLKTLDKLIALGFDFKIYNSKYKKFSQKSGEYFMFDDCSFKSSPLDTYGGSFFKPIFKNDWTERMGNTDSYLLVDNLDNYQKFAKFSKEIGKDNTINDEVNDDFIFNTSNEILLEYKYKTLEEFDLSHVNFDNANISGLNISKNLEAKINFDKIAKDVSYCNFNGYDLKKVVFRDFNIRNTDFRGTGATVDIATCAFSEEGKMNTGTLFDEENKFVFGSRSLTLEQAQSLGIKIYKKEKMYEGN